MTYITEGRFKSRKFIFSVGQTHPTPLQSLTPCPQSKNPGYATTRKIIIFAYITLLPENFFKVEACKSKVNLLEEL